MKRIVSLILILALAAVCVSCSGSPDTQDPSANNSKPTEQATDAPTEAPTEPAAEAKLDVTVCTYVAPGIVIFGGTCSDDVKSVTVTGDAVTETVINTAAASEGRFFIGQVPVTGACTASVAACDADGKKLISADAEVKKSTIKINKMTTDEYSPVFGLDSRMHFYSSLLAYSLSDVINNGTIDRAKNTMSANVEAVKKANPDAEIIYFVIPSSAEVYPETVPAEYTKAEGKTIYDVFKQVAEESGAKVIYPLESMTEHKNDGEGYQLYSYTDSHWTTYGAWVGTSELFNYIKDKYPAAAPRTAEEMSFHTVGMYGGDSLFSFGDNGGFEDFSMQGSDAPTINTGITELTALYDLKMPTETLRGVYRDYLSLYVAGDNNNKATVKNKDGDGLPTALILRDSFSCPCYDMVNDRFSTVWWQTGHSYNFPKGEITTNKPDYVIYIVSERNLVKVMLENSNATICTYAKK